MTAYLNLVIALWAIGCSGSSPPLSADSPPDASIEPYDAHKKAHQIIAALNGPDATKSILAAKDMLASIHAADRCSPEVRKAIGELVTKERQVLRDTAAAAKATRLIARRKFATELERSFLDDSINARISLAGDEKMTLRIDSWVCGRVFVYKTFDSDALHTMAAMGFRKIVCNDDLGTTTQPITPVEESTAFAIDEVPKCAKTKH